ncbi:glycosyltransferase family 2 protein [Thalassococcus profundi]|nr:glycosyltransferase family 2 protein [Thalassococcus profundi]
MRTARLHHDDAFRAVPGARGQPLGRILIDMGALSAADALSALSAAQDTGAPIDRVIRAEALASPEAVLHAQSLHWGAARLDPRTTPPDDRLEGLLPLHLCLREGILPWTRIGDALVIATCQPAAFDDLRQRLPNTLGPVIMGLAAEADIQDILAARHGATLCRAAESCVADAESCRDINKLTPVRAALGGTFALLCLGLLAAAPQIFFTGVLALAVISLLCAQGLKIAALASGVARRPDPDPAPVVPLPSVTLLVPLFQEDAIATALVERLSRLDYPRALLDVLLILEAGDAQTRAVLAKADLPPWMRVVEVPPGTVTTKPRALNYALRFSRGEIVGIYDAEDAPAPDQLHMIAGHFSRAPPRVACLQGILDFYNPRANWLARCFAIEYAMWFRILLPGIARLGFAVPLGGTTVFFRRDALEQVGCWDAHNVTEDADLGIRLARYGYRTELVPTVTREEANARAWPWVKQRSRWLKGYMLTYLVHMRSPARLWRDIGTRGFVGVQLLFLTTLLQFTLAPVLWSFWLLPLGLPHPASGVLDPVLMTALFTLFLSCEAVSVLIGIAAVSRSPHRGLLIWVPTLLFYFPLGTLAAYKGLSEIALRPFYWDKTRHGWSQPDAPVQVKSEDPRLDG